MRQGLGAATNRATDFATNATAWQHTLALTPGAVGNWTPAPGHIIGSQVAAFTRNKLTFTPRWVGPSAWTTNAVGAKVTTASAGGATVAYAYGLYPDDGTGVPDTSRLLASASFTLTAVAVVTAALSASVVLTPGLYWDAGLFTYGTVPTTPHQMLTISSTTWTVPNTDSTTIGTSIRGYAVTGQTVLPTTATAHASFALDGGNDLPVFYLQRSA